MTPGDAVVLAVGEMITKGVNHMSAKRTFGSAAVFQQWHAKPIVNEIPEVSVRYNGIGRPTGSNV